MRARTTVVAAAALGLALAGCNNSAEADIASDACDLMGDVVDEGPEAMMTRLEDFQELEERAREADVSDADMEEAMRAECSDVFDDLEGLLELE